MGDVIHLLPAVTDLINNIPNPIIDWVVEESFVDIPKIHPGVNHIIPVSIRRWRKNLYNKKTWAEIKLFIAKLRSEKYDYVIDAQGLLKSAVIARLAVLNKLSNNNASSIHGFDQNSARGQYLSWFYNKKYNVKKNQHAVHRLKDLFAQIFDYKNNTNVDYGINISNLNPEFINHPYLVFLHCTTWESKKWPESHWQKLIKHALASGYRVKLNSGNQDELEQAKSIVAGLNLDNINNLVEIMPPTSIANLIKIITNSAGVVCVDTGLGHLAAALDKPGVGIYGSTNPVLTAILGDKFVNLSSSYKCSPCLLKKCIELDNTSLNYPPCYKQLNADLVWHKLQQVIESVKIKEFN
jgi:heptosyltransferase-1